MSALKYGIDRIFREIPSEILQLAFMRKSQYFNVNTTIERQISDLVIENIVLRDTNLVGGMTISISIDKCTQTYYEKNPTNHNLVISVPYMLTNNKKIIEPLSLTANIDQNSGYNPTSNVVNNAISNMMYHMTDVNNSFTTSNLELIAPNTILVYEHIEVLSNGYLTVMVENNNNLSNISPRAYPAFGELCVLAAKLYIYNKLVIDLDKGALYSGHELSKLTDIINSYENVVEDYNIFVKEKWTKITFLNDKPSMSSFIQGLVNPNI